MTADEPAASNARGFALIIVLWFLVLIAAIGIYLIANARSETAIAHDTRAAADAEALADAGIARAVFNQIDPVLANRWQLDGTVHQLALPGGQITVRLVDETQKINPNHASDTLLTALFEVCGVDQTRARSLGAAVADWVGPNGPPREFGAKLPQYRAAGRSYGPPNAPIRTLDDLLLVLGMTPEILSAVRPYLTIYTETGVPNVNGAPLVIQRAVTLAARLSGDGAGDGADAAESQSSNNTTSPADAANSTEQPLLFAETTGLSRGGGVFVRDAVLRLEPDSPKGYVVLAWRRGDLSQ